jgi:crossover junction endodeoxyribonuclease RuvC
MSQQTGQTSLTVLGVDPGLTRCGIGVVKGAAGAQLELVDVGVIQTSPSLPLELRLLELEAELISWFDKHRPDVIAVERVFSQHNVRTVMGTGQAAGIALLLAAKRGIPVVMHTPSEVKAAVTGNGRANKSQVADMVVRILSLKEAPKPVDSTDALALAICNIWRGSATSKIAEALRAEKTRISKLVKR